MSKFINITDEQIEATIDQFRKALTGSRLMDGKFNFTAKFDAPEEKATVRFTANAWLKMTTLLRVFDKEVAWHGVCERVEGEENTYLISDIMVYPQVVSGASVQMDETEYAKWIQDNGDDERFYKIHFQGHSHVNMGTSPSGVDLEHQRVIINQLKKDGFYLFAIYNKSLSNTWFIYDMRKNLFFEDKDITIEFEDGFESFLKDAKDMVKEYKPIASTTPAAASATTTKATSGTQLPIGFTPGTKHLEADPTAPANKSYKPYDPMNKTNISSRPKTQIGCGWGGKASISGQESLRGFTDDDDDPYGYSAYGLYGAAMSLR